MRGELFLSFGWRAIKNDGHTFYLAYSKISLASLYYSLLNDILKIFASQY